MKLSVTRQSLSDALAIVAPAVARRATLPILAGVRLEAAPGRLTVEASNLDQTITTSVQANVEDPGVLVVPAALLSSLVGSLIGDSVSLAVEKKERLTVRSGRNQTVLSGFDAEEWPQPATPNAGVSFTLPGSALAAGIGATDYAIAREDGRPALTGILFDVSAERISLAAADGFRLALWRHAHEGPSCQAIVPGVALKAVAKLAKAGDVAVTLDPGRATFSAGDTTVSTRLIEGQFPRYQAIIPTAKDLTLTASAAELDRAVRTVLTVGRAHANIVKLTLDVDRVTFSAESEDGTSSEEVLARVEGAVPFAIAANGQYLSEALGTFAGQIAVEFTTTARPFVIRPAEGVDQMAVVMPMAIGTRANG